MKRLFVTLLLAGLPPVAFGQTAPAEEATVPVQQAEEVKGATPDRFCLQETGSRMVARQNAKGQKRCGSTPGRSYTRSDLDRTGHVDLAEALRALDPAIH